MNDWLEYLTYGQLIKLKRLIKLEEDDEDIITIKLLSVAYDIEIEEVKEMTVSKINRLLEPVSIKYVEKEKKRFKENKKRKRKKFSRFDMLDI